MNNCIPENTQKYLDPLPENRESSAVLSEIQEFRGLYGDEYVESIIWTQQDAKVILDELGIKRGTTFFNFYLHRFNFPDYYRSVSIYGLSEILEDYRKPFWGEKYKNIQNKYLQLSSLEGEYSYFYDKVDDSVYGVDWRDMNEFVLGNTKPLFATFYNFLQWYYYDDDE